MKPIVSWALAIAGLAVGGITLYEQLTAWVPAVGWTSETIISLAFAFFMVAAGGTEIGKHVLRMQAKGEDTKRCKTCGATVPQIAKFCRECGKSF